MSGYLSSCMFGGMTMFSCMFGSMFGDMSGCMFGCMSGDIRIVIMRNVWPLRITRSWSPCHVVHIILRNHLRGGRGVSQKLHKSNFNTMSH